MTEKKVAILLSHIGNRGYNLLKSWCAMDNPNTKTYPVLKKLLKDHLSPKPPVASERFKFQQVKQLGGERLHMYLPRLREAARYCEFGGFYDTMISDRFVGGLANAKTRNNLLNSETALITAQVYDKAVARENSQASSLMMGQSAVNQLNQQHKRGKRKNFKPPAAGDKKSDESKCFKCT